MNLTKFALIVVTQLARVALVITPEDLAIAKIRTLVIHTVNVSRSGIIKVRALVGCTRGITIPLMSMAWI